MDVAKASWIRVKEVENSSQIEKLTPTLHRGEAEAIVLAKELNAHIIILDDNRARKAARAIGLNVAGTLAILRRAKQSA